MTNEYHCVITFLEVWHYLPVPTWSVG